jgi:hypothetical protein
MITFWARNVENYHLHRMLVRLFDCWRRILPLDPQSDVQRVPSNLESRLGALILHSAFVMKVLSAVCLQ